MHKPRRTGKSTYIIDISNAVSSSNHIPFDIFKLHLCYIVDYVTLLMLYLSILCYLLGVYINIFYNVTLFCCVLDLRIFIFRP